MCYMYLVCKAQVVPRTVLKSLHKCVLTIILACAASDQCSTLLYCRSFKSFDHLGETKVIKEQSVAIKVGLKV